MTHAHQDPNRITGADRVRKFAANHDHECTMQLQQAFPSEPPLSLSLSAPRILISLWGTRKLGNFLVPHPRPSSVVAVHRPASSPATGSVNRARNVTQLSLSSLDARASEAVFPTCDPACIPSLALDLASAGLRVRRET